MSRYPNPCMISLQQNRHNMKLQLIICCDLTPNRHNMKLQLILRRLSSWTRSTRIASRRYLFFDKSFFSSLESHWCESRDHVVTQPTIKIEIWSRKVEIGLIGVWHNGNLSQGTNTIGISRMTPRSQLIFDKSNSIRSRTEECKNHSHTLKLKISEVIIIKGCLMDPLCGLIWGPLKTDPKS
jgi:hypothetical protein